MCDDKDGDVCCSLSDVLTVTCVSVCVSCPDRISLSLSPCLSCSLERADH